MAEYSYNTCLWLELATVVRYGTSNLPIDELDVYLQERDQSLILLKDQLGNAQATMKSYIDKGLQDVCLEVSGKVYIKLRPYRMKL